MECWDGAATSTGLDTPQLLLHMGEWGSGTDGADSEATGKELTSPFSLLHLTAHKQRWEVIPQHIVCNMLSWP